MRMPVLQVADAVQADLVELGYEVERRIQPYRETVEYEQLRITVVPRSATNTKADRKRRNHECTVDVGVQQRMEASDATTEEIEGLLDLVHSIDARLADAKRLTSIGAVWLRSEYAPLYLPEHLFEKRLFTSVLRVDYRLTI